MADVPLRRRGSRFALTRARAEAYWRRWLRTRRPWHADHHDTMPRELSPAETERVEQILLRARSVLDDPCKCAGNPPTYEYRKDKRQHCMWCDGLAEEAERCERCGGVTVDPARHGEGWCVDVR